MNLREYRNLLISELEKGNKTETLSTLNAKKELLKSNDEKIRNLIFNLENKNLEEIITIIDTYLQNNSVSSSNSHSLSLNNPEFISFNDDEGENGFSNIILISLTLIVIVVVILLIVMLV